MSVRMRVAFFGVLIFMWAANIDAKAQAGSGKREPASTPIRAGIAGSATDRGDEVAALKSDLQHMRSVLAQMKTNAGFAASVTSPLYHQFELENAMWELEVARLQRHVDALERASKTPQ